MAMHRNQSNHIKLCSQPSDHFKHAITCLECNKILLFFDDKDAFYRLCDQLNQFNGTIYLCFDPHIQTEQYSTLLKHYNNILIYLINDTQIKTKTWELIAMSYSQVQTGYLDVIVSTISFDYILIYDMPSDSQINAHDMNQRGLTAHDSIPALFKWINLNHIGESLFEQGSINESILCFKSLLKKEPNNTIALNNLAVIAFNNENFSLAKHLLTKAIQINSTHLISYLNLAEVYFKLGNMNSAAACLQDAFALAPDNPIVFKAMNKLSKHIEMSTSTQETTNLKSPQMVNVNKNSDKSPVIKKSYHISRQLNIDSLFGKNNAIITAHPDDETMWAGGFLIKYHHANWTSICCSIPREADEEMRAFDYFNACRILGVFPKLSPYVEPEINQPLYLDWLDVKPYDCILTHGKQGEYGHLHHMNVYQKVIQEADCPVISFGYGQGSLKLHLSNNEYNQKMKALRQYVVCHAEKEKWQYLIVHFPLINQRIETFDLSKL